MAGNLQPLSRVGGWRLRLPEEVTDCVTEEIGPVPAEVIRVEKRLRLVGRAAAIHDRQVRVPLLQFMQTANKRGIEAVPFAFGLQFRQERRQEPVNADPVPCGKIEKLPDVLAVGR
jgi:hypothetical protein